METYDEDKVKIERMRATLASDSLKKVDIRIDFSGVPDINPWVNGFTNSALGKVFSGYHVEESHEGQYDAVSMQALARLVGMPVERIRRMPIHVFENGAMDGHEDRLSLSIDNVSAQLSIQCVNYTSIDDYIGWMLRFIEALRKDFNLFRIRRFAIRKLDGFMSFDLKEIAGWIIPERFYDPTRVGQIGYETTYGDKFLMEVSDELSAFVVDSRLFRVGTSGDDTAYQALVDLQVNADSSLVADLPVADSESLGKIAIALNDCLFRLFLRYITPEYISTHQK